MFGTPGMTCASIAGSQWEIRNALKFGDSLSFFYSHFTIYFIIFIKIIFIGLINKIYFDMLMPLS